MKTIFGVSAEALLNLDFIMEYKEIFLLQRLLKPLAERERESLAGKSWVKSRATYVRG